MYGVTGSTAGLAVVFAGLEVAPLVGNHLRSVQELLLRILPAFTEAAAQCAPQCAPPLPALEDHFERRCEEQAVIIVRQSRELAEQRGEIAMLRQQLAQQQQAHREAEDARAAHRQRQRQLAEVARRREQEAALAPGPASLFAAVNQHGATRNLDWMRAHVRQCAEDREAMARKRKREQP